MIRADLHVHSCLSPCGDPEMNPFDLVGIAKLNGLDLLALTDHNSVRNCPAAAAAAEAYGLSFLPGCEVNTSEDIHCVCLFPDLASAMAFGDVLETDIFGHQTVFHADGTTEEYPHLLINACDISILDLPALVRSHGGVCYPAHIDRESNGLLAILGSWPVDLDVTAAEIREILPPGIPAHLNIVQGSDAHRLADMPAEGFLLPLASPDFSGLRQYLHQTHND